MQIVHLLALGTVLLPRLAGATTANDICPPGADPCVLQNFLTVTPGVSTLLDFGNRAFQIASGRRLIVNDGDTLTIMARTVTLQTGAAISGPTGTRRTGATVIIVATGDIQFQRSGGSIDLAADGAAGTARITSTGGNITADGDLIVKGTPGDGGLLTMCAGGTVTLTGTIRVSGGGDSLGGDVTVAAGGSIIASGPIIDASGGLGGGSIDLEAGVAKCPISGTSLPLTPGSALSVTATLDVSGTGGASSGGCIDLAAAGNVTTSGMIAAQGAGSSDSGGSGADLQIDAGGSIEIDKTINMFGGGPDGEGGSATLSALLDIIQNQPIAAQGIGSEGFGGVLEMDADRLLSLRAPIDAHGGPLGGGGSIDLAGGTVEAKAKIDAGGDGGVILIDSHPHELPAAAGTVTVSGDLHADGATGGGDLIEIDGCDVTVGPTGSLIASGASAENLLEASGRMTIQGGLSALPAGTNHLSYRDPTKLPVVTSRPTPSFTQMLDSTLPACRGPVVPVCGNGVLEGDEECDKGDPTSCDGCSSTCKIEACGNGRKECAEKCDDGNVVDGDGCDSNCTPTGCGNGIVTAGEACDDGNTNPDDSCDANCKVTGCGDGHIGPGEECDHGPTNGTPGDSCDAVCLLVRCGNNVLESGEECDDGNTTPCDGCAPGCRIERCGDGIPECGEACDLGSENGMPGSGCNTSCARCSLGSGADCPCAEDLDCHPLGRCAGIACVSGLCTPVPVPACDDHDACNGVETCAAGSCFPGTAPTCHDGNLCTDDTCDGASGCAYPPKTGFAAITCRLDTIDLALQQSQDSDATPKVRQKLGKLLAAMRATLGQAEAAQGNTKRATKLLRASGKSLRKLTGLIAAAAKKNQIISSLAGQLTSAAAGANTAIDTVRASLTP